MSTSQLTLKLAVSAFDVPLEEKPGKLNTVPASWSVLVRRVLPWASPCGRYFSKDCSRMARASRRRAAALLASGLLVSACSTRPVSSASLNASHQRSSATAPAGAGDGGVSEGAGRGGAAPRTRAQGANAKEGQQGEGAG